jgi:phosphopantetheinyl transferase
MGLALQLNRNPTELSFARDCANCGSGDHGAPRLCDWDLHKVQFSVGHSHEMAAVAVANDCAVGLDIERDIGAAAWSDLRSLVANDDDDPGLRREHCWTAKEAVVKFTALGLAIPLRAVAVKICGHDVGSARLRHRHLDLDLAIRWFTVDPYTIAVAHEKGGPGLQEAFTCKRLGRARLLDEHAAADEATVSSRVSALRRDRRTDASGAQHASQRK